MCVEGSCFVKKRFKGEPQGLAEGRGGEGSQAPQQQGFNRIAAAKSAEAGRNPLACTCVYTNPLCTCTLIKSARRGLGQTEVIVQGECENTGSIS